MLSDQQTQSLRQRLLDLPGRSVKAAADELGIPLVDARLASEKLQLSNQKDRVRASGRSISRAAATTRSIWWKAVALRPGAMIHFDAAMIGRLVPANQARSREIIVYSAVDRCSGWAWTRLATAISGTEAARCIRQFAADSPFPWAGAHIIVDNRWDTQSRAFLRALREVGAHRRAMVGHQPWSNSTVEMHHRMLKYAGFASVPFDHVKTVDELVEFIRWFDHQFNHDRKALFAQSARLAPAETLAALKAYASEPWHRRILLARMFYRHQLRSAKPLAIETTGANPFRVLAPKLTDEVLAGPEPDALLIRSPRAPARRRAPQPLAERNHKHRVPGVYLYD